MEQIIDNIIRSKITIIANEDEAVGKCNNQDRCLLFTLPREVRDIIWNFVTAPYEDLTDTFDKKAYYYRPGHTARLKTETALLHTCRRIWLEANALPMQQAEHSFYYDRAAPDARTPAWTAKLTAHNRENLAHLHLFVQLRHIERLSAHPEAVRSYFSRTPSRPGDFQPRMLHVTVRHTDWWYWEDDDPLKLEYSWVEALLNTPDLRNTETLKLELETVDYKLGQLLPIVKQIRRLKSTEQETHVIDGVLHKSRFELVPEQGEYTWEGPSDINHQSHTVYRNRPRLRYCVIILTWKLKFPELPGAIVSKLRRVPDMTAATWQKTTIRRDKISKPFDMRCGASSVPSRFRFGGRKYTSGGEPPDQPIPFWKWLYAETVLYKISQEQAVSHETCRRQMFINQLVDKQCKELTTKWAAESSLLKIVD